MTLTFSNINHPIVIPEKMQISWKIVNSTLIHDAEQEEYIEFRFA